MTVSVEDGLTVPPPSLAKRTIAWHRIKRRRNARMRKAIMFVRLSADHSCHAGIGQKDRAQHDFIYSHINNALKFPETGCRELKSASIDKVFNC